MDPTGCSEMSVTNYEPKLRDTQGGRWSHLRRDEKPEISQMYLILLEINKVVNDVKWYISPKSELKI